MIGRCHCAELLLMEELELEEDEEADDVEEDEEDDDEEELLTEEELLLEELFQSLRAALMTARRESVLIFRSARCSVTWSLCSIFCLLR